MNYFGTIVGQQVAKTKLSFYLEGYRATGVLSPTLFVSKRGSGKTIMARSMKDYLVDPKSRKPKPFVEINGASLRKLEGLVQKAFVPFQGSHVTYFIDEAHAMDSLVQEFLLSILAPDKDNKSKASYDGTELEFDFSKQSFLFATTDPQRLTLAFKSRCSRIDLEPYTDEQIAEILRKHAIRNNITFRDEIESQIALVCRGTPREAAVTMTDNVKRFCAIHSKDSFGVTDWNKLKEILNVRCFGLNETEYQVLKLLKQNGAMSLTHISNSLSLGRSAVQNDIEPFLMEKKLIKIDGKRYITHEGIKALV